VKESEENHINAILTTSAVGPGAGPEEVVKAYETISELRRKKASETFTVPKVMEPLLKQALEEKARRER
jgi:hypothetical protein